MDNKIYALFEYYGDGVMCPQNYLCIKYGTPESILQWLLLKGYLMEIYQYGQVIGFSSDAKELDKIMALLYFQADPTIELIKSIDIHLPSCCSCRAVSESFNDYPAFLDKVKSLIAKPSTGTVKQGKDLEKFVSILEAAGASMENYQQLSNELPERYI